MKKYCLTPFLFLTLPLVYCFPSQILSPFAKKPKFSNLKKYKNTMTEAQFKNHLPAYLFKTNIIPFTHISKTHIEIKFSKGKNSIKIPFAINDSKKVPIPRYWRSKLQIKTLNRQKPLNELRIVIDPGHLGGKWAVIEERHFFMKNGDKPICEGDMTLTVAKMMKEDLEKLGATVFLTRENTNPQTKKLPKNFEREARNNLRKRYKKSPKEEYGFNDDPRKMRTVKGLSERYFYRTYEIRKRGELVNKKIKPDLVLCLHFNAEDWGPENSRQLVDKNHFHILINGAYSSQELLFEDIFYEFLHKIFNQSLFEEINLAKSISKSMLKETGLSPYNYKKNASVNKYSKTIYFRNLMANRLYQCPTIYLEPYVMNGKKFYDRFQKERKLDARHTKSIYSEYVRGVVSGLVNYYKN